MAKKFYTQLINSGQWMQWNQVLIFLEAIDHYRYIKYFALPSIYEAIAYFDLPRDVEEITNPHELARNIYSGVEVTFAEDVEPSDDGEVRYRLWMIGPMKSFAKQYLSFLKDTPLLSCINYKDQYSKKELISLYSAIRWEENNDRFDKATKTAVIGWENAVEAEKLQKFLEIIKKQLERHLIINRKNYISYLETEDTKTNLIEL